MIKDTCVWLYTWLGCQYVSVCIIMFMGLSICRGMFVCLHMFPFNPVSSSLISYILAENLNCFLLLYFSIISLTSTMLSLFQSSHVIRTIQWIGLKCLHKEGWRSMLGNVISSLKIHHRWASWLIGESRCCLPLCVWFESQPNHGICNCIIF